ncbi:MAG: hypothetical protein ACK6EB_28145, partial [Planctomyces sp.]
SDGAVDLNGYLVSGGEVTIVHNAAGQTIGQDLARHDGTSTLSINTPGQIKVGREVYAGRTLTLNAGQAVALDGGDFSDIGIVVTGSGTLRTGASGSSITLLSDSGIRTLAAAGPDAAAYAIYAPGNHSTVTLQSASLSSGPEIRIDSAIFAAGNIITQSSSATSPMTSTVVSASGKLESLAGNITIGSAELISVSGMLLAGRGTITVTSTANTTLASTSRIDSSTAISLTTGADLLIDGTIGTQIAPQELTLIAATGKISVAAATGRLHS